MAIVRWSNWDPFGEALRMQRDMDRIFARLGTTAGGSEPMAWMPRIDVKRSGDDLVLRAELPGMKVEDVEIELSGGVLTIRGERKAEEHKENEGWIIRESNYGSFERSMAVPETVDPASITAEFRDGVLEVYVPKALEAVKPRTTKIEIGGADKPQMTAGEEPTESPAVPSAGPLPANRAETPVEGSGHHPIFQATPGAYPPGEVPPHPNEY